MLLGRRKLRRAQFLPILGTLADVPHAKWTENASEDPSDSEVTKYTISYDLNGGTLDGKTGIITIEAEEGSTITIPASLS